MALATLRRQLLLPLLQLKAPSPLPLRMALSANAAAAAPGKVSGEQQEATDSPSSDCQQRHRLKVFNEELDRQRARSKRSVDRIEVVYTGPDGQAHSLFMNSGVSTPMDVAKHLSEELCTESVLALVNSTPWDMHRPLSASCSIAFLNFKTPGSKKEASDIKLCNSAMWRSGSLILGSVIETAFKEAYSVKLISFPPPFIQSGSFIYDCQVTSIRQPRTPLAWEPSKSELRALSLAAERLLSADHQFQPLDAPGPVAMEMFKHNDCKLAAVKSILQAKPDQTVTVYRVGDFVDLSAGPMISRAGLIGRFALAAVHQISAPDFGQLMRFQGLAVPRAFLAHFSSVELLEKRAAALNRSFLPTRPRLPAAAAPGGAAATAAADLS